MLGVQTDISNCSDLVRDKIQFRLRDGRTIYFLKDVWCGYASFQKRFSNDARVMVDINCKVIECFDRSNGGYWIPQFQILREEKWMRFLIC